MATSENLIRVRQLTLLFMLISLVSCSERTASTASSPAVTGAVLATVTDYSEVDGCTFLLELSNGQKLHPVNLAEDFKRKGLKLFITYKYYDGVSTCMAGRMVTLTSATIAKEDNR